MKCPVEAGVLKDLITLQWLSVGLIKNLSSFKMEYINFEAKDFNEESDLNFSSDEHDNDRSFINNNEEEPNRPAFIGSLMRLEIHLRFQMMMMDHTLTQETYDLKCLLLIIRTMLSLMSLDGLESVQSCLNKAFHCLMLI